MGLLDFIDDFDKPEFYKEDSELEKQVEALKKLSKEYPDNEEISKKLRISELGLKGENEIVYELKNSNIGMYILRDINLKFEDLTAQIDFLILTPYYNYLIECKNLVGNITINENGDFIREYTYNNKNIKEGIYSPLRQSERHKEIYKKIWKSRNNNLVDKVFRKNSIDYWFKSIVVMANSGNILNTRYAPREVKNSVIKSDQLINYIKKDMENISKEDRPLKQSKKVLEENARRIKEYYNTKIDINYEEEFRKKYVNSGEVIDLKEDNKTSTREEKLREKLIAFRDKKRIEKNIPAFYIFNNKELEEIIKVRPKTVEELKNSKILTNTKVYLHGDEIIEIINSVKE